MKWIKTNIYYILAVVVVLGLIGRYIYQKPRFVQGEVAPGFSVTLNNGTSLNLEDLRGQYVLLHFWGSWCGPCRKENPELVRIYEEYGAPATEKSPAFTIVSIAAETDSMRWQQAIYKDGLNWPRHYADFKRFSGELMNLYHVREIPANYLIDPQGYIIGVNLEAAQLEKLLIQRLARN